MAKRKSVGELIIDIKARDRDAGKTLDLTARRLRSLQTIGFTTAIGIAAATGTAAASIAAIGTAAVVAGAALAALGAFGIGALAALAIGSAAQTDFIKETWENATERMGEVWARGPSIMQGYLESHRRLGGQCAHCHPQDRHSVRRDGTGDATDDGGRPGTVRCVR